ncbi:MAG: response regulator [Myxococcales bacterium]|nr:response regulator [Myxococcales bacterium]
MSARVLIVEDEPALIDIFRRILARAGVVTVDAAMNGRAGLEKARERAYDVIFSDLMMPEMDGVAMVHSLRAREGPNTNTPVVVVTSFLDEGRWAAKELGVRYFAKPIRKHQVLTVLRELLG